MIHKVVVSVMLLFTACAYGFLYDSALSDAHHNNWEAAHQKLATLIVDNVDNGDMLYDAGVAAHNLGKFSEASAYFERAGECGVSCDLRVRSYFNAGNSLVSLQELEKALVSYNQALSIEPDNTFVKHNKETVEQMLKQKQEQEKQNKDQQKCDQDNKDQRNQNSGKDSNQNDSTNNGQDKNMNSGGQKEPSQGDNGDDDQPGDKSKQQQKNNSADGQQSSNKPDQSQRGESKDDGNSAQKSDVVEKEEKSACSAHDHQREGNRDEEGTQDKSGNERHNGSDNPKDNMGSSLDDQGNGHNKSSNKNARNSTIASHEDKDQGGQQTQAHEFGAEKQGEGTLNDALEGKMGSPLLVRILQEQEARDKAANQRLIGTKIGRNGGADGQNCW